MNETLWGLTALQWTGIALCVMDLATFWTLIRLAAGRGHSKEQRHIDRFGATIGPLRSAADMEDCLNWVYKAPTALTPRPVVHSSSCKPTSSRRAGALWTVNEEEEVEFSSVADVESPSRRTMIVGFRSFEL